MKVALIDKNTNVCLGVTYYDSVSQIPKFYDFVEINDNVDVLYRKFTNGQWSAEKFEPTPSEPPLSPIDMIGMVTTQNSLELSELKQQVEAIGQGVVEIMLNQQMGGM